MSDVFVGLSLIIILDNIVQAKIPVRFEAEIAAVFMWNWETEELIPMCLLERVSLNHHPLIGSCSF
jgi:hypothetical protein